MRCARALIALVCACFLGWTAGQASALSLAVDVDPDTLGVQNMRTVGFGEVFQVDILITDVDPGAALQAYELDLAFDPPVLSATGITDAGFLLPPVVTISADLGLLEAEILATTFGLGGASGSGVLATVSFQGTDLGVSALDLNDVLLSAPFGVEIPVEPPFEVAFVRVPEPAVALLWLAGLLCVLALRLRRSVVSLGAVLFVFALSPGSALAQAPSADLNGDGEVNVFDVSLVSSCQGMNPATEEQCASSDTDGDGDVDEADFEFVGATAGGAECGNGEVEEGEDCDPGPDDESDCCAAICQYEDLGRLCREAAGSCDVPEVCSGEAAECPADEFASSAIVCRAPVGGCDLAESCTGSGPACPGNAFAPGGTLCRAAAGPCDIADVCNGVSGACTDVKAAAGVVCRPTAQECDAPEICDGSSNACPVDQSLPDGFLCDDGETFCTNQGTCLDGVCQDDDFPDPERCGDGTVDVVCGEECDPPGSEPGPGLVCSDFCTQQESFDFDFSGGFDIGVLPEWFSEVGTLQDVFGPFGIPLGGSVEIELKEKQGDSGESLFGNLVCSNGADVVIDQIFGVAGVSTVIDALEDLTCVLGISVSVEELVTAQVIYELVGSSFGFLLQPLLQPLEDVLGCDLADVCAGVDAVVGCTNPTCRDLSDFLGTQPSVFPNLFDLPGFCACESFGAEGQALQDLVDIFSFEIPAGETAQVAVEGDGVEGTVACYNPADNFAKAFEQAFGGSASDLTADEFDLLCLASLLAPEAGDASLQYFLQVLGVTSPPEQTHDDASPCNSNGDCPDPLACAEAACADLVAGAAATLAGFAGTCDSEPVDEGESCGGACNQGATCEDGQCSGGEGCSIPEDVGCGQSDEYQFMVPWRDAASLVMIQDTGPGQLQGEVVCTDDEDQEQVRQNFVAGGGAGAQGLAAPSENGGVEILAEAGDLNCNVGVFYFEGCGFGDVSDYSLGLMSFGDQPSLVEDDFIGCETDEDCTDDNACTEEMCVENAFTIFFGRCFYPERDCSDGNECTSDDCDPVQGCMNPPLEAIDDGVGCTFDFCDPGSGNITHTPDDDICADANLCTFERCDAELDCQPNGGVNPDDGVDCTQDTCNPQTGLVVNVPIDLACADDDLCTEDICNPQAGCQNPAKNVNDNVECTDDSCDPASGEIIHARNDEACDDGLFCNGEERCNTQFGCETVPFSVPDGEDGIECTTELCVEAIRGFIQNENDELCDDGNVCTFDRCSQFDGCNNTAIPERECDDEDACTDPDLCTVEGECVGVPLPEIDDGVTCTLDFCITATGEVFHEPDDAVCQSSNECIAGVCDPVFAPDPSGCILTPRTGESCDDGDICTGPDTCQVDASCEGPTLEPPPRPSCDETACIDELCVPLTLPELEELSPACQDIVEAVGALDSFCITVEFDQLCVDAAKAQGAQCLSQQENVFPGRTDIFAFVAGGGTASVEVDDANDGDLIWQLVTPEGVSTVRQGDDSVNMPASTTYVFIQTGALTSNDYSVTVTVDGEDVEVNLISDDSAAHRCAVEISVDVQTTSGVTSASDTSDWVVTTNDLFTDKTTSAIPIENVELSLPSLGACVEGRLATSYVPFAEGPVFCNDFADVFPQDTFVNHNTLKEGPLCDEDSDCAASCTAWCNSQGAFSAQAWRCEGATETHVGACNCLCGQVSPQGGEGMSQFQPPVEFYIGEPNGVCSTFESNFLGFGQASVVTGVIETTLECPNNDALAEPFLKSSLGVNSDLCLKPTTDPPNATYAFVAPLLDVPTPGGGIDMAAELRMAIAADDCVDFDLSINPAPPNSLPEESGCADPPVAALLLVPVLLALRLRRLRGK